MPESFRILQHNCKNNAIRCNPVNTGSINDFVCVASDFSSQVIGNDKLNIVMGP